MQTVTMEEAKAQLPELLEAAAKSQQSFEIINSKGVLLSVRVTDKEASPPLPRKAGFMKDEIVVPQDFDTMCSDEILEMFGIKE